MGLLSNIEIEDIENDIRIEISVLDRVGEMLKGMRENKIFFHSTYSGFCSLVLQGI